MDFQFDSTTDGRPVKTEHTRECLGGLVARSITGDDLIDELDRLAAERGYPAVLRRDNGPELACAAMANWAGNERGWPSSRRATADQLQREVRRICAPAESLLTPGYPAAGVVRWTCNANAWPRSCKVLIGCGVRRSARCRPWGGL